LVSSSPEIISSAALPWDLRGPLQPIYTLGVTFPTIHKLTEVLSAKAIHLALIDAVPIANGPELFTVANALIVGIICPTNRDLPAALLPYTGGDIDVWTYAA